jgi:hypothetical protein
MIKSEKDVRKKVNGWFGEDAFWVEYAAGGTRGMPDLIYCIAEKSLYIELKVFTGDWSIDLRQGQKKVGQRLLDRGQRLFFLVGRKGSDVVFMAHGEEIIAKKGSCDPEDFVKVDGAWDFLHKIVLKKPL